MAYPHRVARITLSGDMFGGAEQWSTGFYMGNETADSGVPTEQGAADIAAAWATFFSDAAVAISNQYQFKLCKVQQLNNDGKPMTDTTVYYAPPTVVKGAAAAPPLPPQIALVATLANSLPRGLATKGRMFLPGMTTNIDNTGHIPAFNADTISTKLQTFFETILNDADTPGRAVLASLGVPLAMRPGAIRNVTQIRIGNVYDTQRRRRNALTETYTIKPVNAV